MYSHVHLDFHSIISTINPGSLVKLTTCRFLRGMKWAETLGPEIISAPLVSIAILPHCSWFCCVYSSVHGMVDVKPTTDREKCLPFPKESRKGFLGPITWKMKLPAAQKWYVVFHFYWACRNLKWAIFMIWLGATLPPFLILVPLSTPNPIALIVYSLPIR